MKQIWKVSFLAIALLIGINVNAQDSPLSLGVKVGANLSNAGGSIPDPSAKFGFNAGFTVDYGFTPNWYLQTGLEFTMKGYKLTKGIHDESMNPMYIQLPVHAAYKLPVADGVNVVLHAGPYVALGVGGKAEYKKTGEKADFFSNDYAQRFDAGLGGGLGVEFGAISVNLGCDFGLVDISKYPGYSIKNQNAYLSLGYRFW